MDKPEIKITHESVTFVGCEGSGNMVFRPKTMSVSQWLEFWEGAQQIDSKQTSRLREEIRESKESIAELERRIEDLEGMISQLEN